MLTTSIWLVNSDGGKGVGGGWVKSLESGNTALCSATPVMVVTHTWNAQIRLTGVTPKFFHLATGIKVTVRHGILITVKGQGQMLMKHYILYTCISS
jgi:hypothetical protein